AARLTEAPQHPDLVQLEYDDGQHRDEWGREVHAGAGHRTDGRGRPRRRRGGETVHATFRPEDDAGPQEPDSGGDALDHPIGRERVQLRSQTDERGSPEREPYERSATSMLAAVGALHPDRVAEERRQGDP